MLRSVYRATILGPQAWLSSVAVNSAGAGSVGMISGGASSVAVDSAASTASVVTVSVAITSGGDFSVPGVSGGAGSVDKVSCKLASAAVVSGGAVSVAGASAGVGSVAGGSGAVTTSSFVLMGVLSKSRPKPALMCGHYKWLRKTRVASAESGMPHNIFGDICCLAIYLEFETFDWATLRIAQAAHITSEDTARRAKPSCRKLMMSHLPATYGALEKALTRSIPGLHRHRARRHQPGGGDHGILR